MRLEKNLQIETGSVVNELRSLLYQSFKYHVIRQERPLEHTAWFWAKSFFVFLAKNIVTFPSSSQEQMAACQVWFLPRSPQDLQLTHEIQKVEFLKKLQWVSKGGWVGRCCFLIHIFLFFLFLLRSPVMISNGFHSTKASRSSLVKFWPWHFKGG